MSLFGIERAVCMCLDKRRDQWDSVLSQLRGVGIDAKPFVMGDGKLLDVHYDHVDNPFRLQTENYEEAVGKLFRRSLVEGVESLFVAEDDVYVQDDFAEVVEAAQRQLRNVEWDILYLGCNRHGAATTYAAGPNLLQCRGALGLIGCVFKSNTFADVGALRPSWHTGIDGLIARHVHPKYRVYSVYPNVIDQIPGAWSFNENRYSDAQLQRTWRTHRGRSQSPTPLF